MRLPTTVAGVSEKEHGFGTLNILGFRVRITVRLDIVSVIL
jgi:hypothetical protein